MGAKEMHIEREKWSDCVMIECDVSFRVYTHTFSSVCRAQTCAWLCVYVSVRIATSDLWLCAWKRARVHIRVFVCLLRVCVCQIHERNHTISAHSILLDTHLFVTIWLFIVRTYTHICEHVYMKTSYDIWQGKSGRTREMNRKGLRERTWCSGQKNCVSHLINNNQATSDDRKNVAEFKWENWMPLF